MFPMPVRRFPHSVELPAAVRAGLWILTAGGMFVLMMAIARHLSDRLDMLVIVFWRAAFGILFMAPWLARRGLVALHTKKSGGHLVRGLASYGGLCCLFYAATMMPLADITAINFIRPIVASGLAIVVLGEAALGRRWAATLIGFAGALIVVRPGFAEVNEGVFLVLSAVVFGSVGAIAAKYLVRTDHPDTMAMYMVLIVTPVALVPALFVWQWPDFDTLMFLLALGGLGTLSQRALSRAYRAADATVVMSLDFTRLPVAALVGYVLFAELPDIWIWVGGAVIAVSSVFIAHRESVGTRA